MLLCVLTLQVGQFLRTCDTSALSCAAVWRKRGLPLPKKKSVMFEIIISIGLYIGAIVLLVKGAIIYCEHCPE